MSSEHTLVPVSVVLIEDANLLGVQPFVGMFLTDACRIFVRCRFFLFLLITRFVSKEMIKNIQTFLIPTALIKYIISHDCGTVKKDTFAQFTSHFILKI